MRTKLLAVFATLFAATLLLASAPAGAADAFPTRPIRMFIPYVPGGSTDFVARAMLNPLVEALGQPLVLDNRPGASGNIAVELTARANPDGYTMLFANVGAISINPALYKALPVQPLRDLACVNVAANLSTIFVVHPSLPVRSLKEFIAYASERPGKINWGSANFGNTSTLGMSYFASKTGIDLVLVSYKGAGAVTIALLSGEVTAGFVSTAATLPFVRAEKLRALAVRGAKRFEMLPDVPTIAECGFPELTSDSWQAVFVPARTPQAIVARMNGAMSRALKDPRVIEQFKTNVAFIMDIGGKDCAAFVKSQTAFWTEVVRKVGMEGKL